MLTIDGSVGEGGGQVLRTSLALAMVTGRAVRLHQIRARRAKPGLRRQHLVAVRAAAKLCNAVVQGAELGSRELTFEPRAVVPGEYQFDIGSAGSTTLVLHTLLPPLVTAAGPSRVVLEGGTHNPLAPPFEQFVESFLPLISRLGPRVTARLERHGFFPAGGGRIVVDIEPVARLTGLELRERGPLRRRWVQALVARLPRHIADRELAVVARRLGLAESEQRVIEIFDSRGPGNALLVGLESEGVTVVFSAIGRKGLPAEAVADDAAQQALTYLDAQVPVDEHLADQLLVPLALAGQGVFRTNTLSGHLLTQIELIPQFLDVEIVSTRDEASPSAAAVHVTAKA